MDNETKKRLVSVYEFIAENELKPKEMKKQNKGGRPETDRKNAVTVRLSDEAVRLLSGEHNKSAFLDGLIRGKQAQVECPHCGKVFTIKTED